VEDFFDPAQNAYLGRVGAPDGQARPAHEKLERVTEGRDPDELDPRARHEAELHDAPAKRAFAAHVLDGRGIPDAELCEGIRITQGDDPSVARLKLKIKFIHV
jgi:hypothetical protein